MKRAPAMTIEQLAELLRRSRQVAEADIPVILERWQREAGDNTADGTRFTRWLVARSLLTERQVNELFGDNVNPVLSAAPMVPVAQALSRPAPLEAPAAALRAVIVAPAAKPRPMRAEVPTAAAARMESPALPVEAVIDVELADLPMPAALPMPPAAEPEINVELIAMAPPPAQDAPAPRVETKTAAPPVDWTYVWVLLFLGALGLLAVEFAGWVLGNLAAWIF